MKRWSALALCAGFFALLVPGCHKNAASMASENAKLFQSADPAVKGDWDAAVAAFRTNGYATAIITLKNLRQQTNISSQQATAVDQMLTAVNDQMYEAANKGDANATQSIEDLRKAMGR
jgi:hypothetical protein